jgi:lambda repressor-like predicted transcriptional regulator
MAQRRIRETVKTELRIRYGSVAAFERLENLPARSVRDVLSGKSRARIARAVAKAIDAEPHELFPDRFSPNGDSINRRGLLTHRLNAGAR